MELVICLFYFLYFPRVIISCLTLRLRWVESFKHQINSGPYLIKKKENLILCSRSVGIMHEKSSSYLFLICAVQVSPLLDWFGQVKRVHGYFNLPNDIVFGEAIKVIHWHDQSLPAHLLEWNLEFKSRSGHACGLQEAFDTSHVSRARLIRPRHQRWLWLWPGAENCLI